MPVPGVYGSDILVKARHDWRVIANPFDSEQEQVVVPANAPDFGLLHVYRADRDGNAVASATQDSRLIAQSARRVIVTAEEIVAEPFARLEAWETPIAGIHVAAVILAPRGAAPMAMPYRYDADEERLREYARLAATEAGFQEYLARYVLATETRAVAAGAGAVS